MSNSPLIIDQRNTPRPGIIGFTTFNCGRINWAMVMHNAHLLAKQEISRDKYWKREVRPYRQYFAEQLRDQLLHTHSMSAWKLGKGVKVTDAYIAAVSTDGPIQFQQAAE